MSYFSYHFWFISYALIEFLPYFFFHLYILVKKIKLNNNKNKGNDYVRRNGCCNTRDLSPKCQNSCYIQDKSHPTFIMIISFPLLSFNFSVPYSVGMCMWNIYTYLYLFNVSCHHQHFHGIFELVKTTIVVHIDSCVFPDISLSQWHIHLVIYFNMNINKVFLRVK